VVGGSLAGGGAAAPPGGQSGFSLELLALEPEILVVRFDPLKQVIITAGNDRVIKVITHVIDSHARY
jgi:hypothetical protein